jgi:hypothetical protein
VHSGEHSGELSGVICVLLAANNSVLLARPDRNPASYMYVYVKQFLFVGCEESCFVRVRIRVRHDDAAIVHQLQAQERGIPTLALHDVSIPQHLH